MPKKINKGGRPPMPPGESLSAAVTLRLTPDLAKKLNTLGGVAWLRERLSKAKVPA